MDTPYAVVYRLPGDDDWKLINLRMHPDPAGAANAAADWVHEQLRTIGIDRNTTRSHVTGTRAELREHPDRAVTVTLPGHNAPLLHVMAAAVTIPAAGQEGPTG